MNKNKGKNKLNPQSKKGIERVYIGIFGRGNIGKS